MGSVTCGSVSAVGQADAGAASAGDVGGGVTAEPATTAGTASGLAAMTISVASSRRLLRCLNGGEPNAGATSSVEECSW